MTYTNLVQTEEFSTILASAAYPTTYFAGSDGTVLTMPVKIANFDVYSERIQEALGVIG